MSDSREQTALKRAILELRRLRQRVEQTEDERHEPVAVIGLGCRIHGGAESPEAYWRLLRDGVDAITEIPPERWDLDSVYDPDPDVPGKLYIRRGGFLRQLERFDPEHFGIAPREAAGMDPQQRLLLEVGWEALEHAGQAPERLSGSATGIFFGVNNNEYFQLAMARDPRQIDSYSISGGVHSMAAGRLSYLLGLHGPSLSLDTACSSSLSAVHLAVQQLRAKTCDLALAGGVNLTLDPKLSIGLCRLRMLSPDGRCKTFDASADGFVQGEGCGVVVLKRLPDAVRDRDNILAVIRGTALNHDGRSAGLTAPSGPAQEAVIEAALADGRVDRHAVSYIEAHGTGTELGDPIEVRALAATYGRERSRERPLLIGSAKTNIGHIGPASGIAGLLKLVLSLQHGEIPRHLHFEQPNPHIPWDTTPVSVVTESRPWRTGDGQGPDGRRLAGVSSFGFSGTNVHVIVEEPPAPEPALPAPDAHLLVLSARTPTALAEVTRRYAESLDPASLAEICHTASTGRNAMRHRLAIACRSKDELRERLQAARVGTDSPGLWRGEMPTRGVQIEFRFTEDEAGRAGESLDALRSAWPEVVKLAPEWSDGHDLLAVHGTLAALLRAWGVEPNAVSGLGRGELAAARVSGVLDAETTQALANALDRGEDFTHQLTTASRHSPSVRWRPAASSLGLHGRWVESTEASTLSDSRLLVEISPALILGDSSSLTPSSARRSLLDVLAQLFVSGAPVDWAAVDQGAVQYKVPLPTYPFEGANYWLPPMAPRVHDVSTRLPGRRLDLACDEVIYALDVDAHTPSRLVDHQVHGEVVVPAAFLIACLSTLPETAGKTLRDLVFLRPMRLGLPDDAADAAEAAVTVRTLQTIYREVGELGTVRLASKARGEDTAPWTVHAEGRVTATDAEPAGKLDLDGLAQRLPITFDRPSWLARAASMQIEIGPTFQGVANVRSGGGEALACIALAPSATWPGDERRPALLDACFQVVGACLPDHDEPRTFLPFAIESLRVRGTFADAFAGEEFWCWARCQEGTGADPGGGFTFDLQIARGDGRLVLDVEGFQVRAATAQQVQGEALDDDREFWRGFYRPAWDSSPAPEPADASLASGQILIVDGHAGEDADDEDALAFALQAAIERAGRPTLRARSTDLASIPAGTELETVIYLGGFDLAPDPASLGGLWTDLESGCGGLLALVQHLAARAREPRLAVVTRGACAIRSTRPSPSQAAVWGLAGVVAVEHPSMAGWRLDLDPLSTDIEQDAEALAAEVLRSPSQVAGRHLQVGWRHGERYALRLEQAERSPDSADALPSSLKSGTSLITGGLGGLGWAVAQDLIARGVRHLVLVGRSHPSAEILEAIGEFERDGVRIGVWRGDVSHEADVSALIGEIAQDWPPLRGIFHAAGVLSPGILLQQEWSNFAAVLAPKAIGAWLLDQHTRDLELDAFVLFSSIAAFLGSPGQGNYAAANAFLDALAHRRDGAGQAGLSLNWGAWSGVGMAARSDARAKDLQRRTGLGTLDVRQGVQALSSLLSPSETGPQWAIVPRADWAEFVATTYGDEPPDFLRDLMAANGSANGHGVVVGNGASGNGAVGQGANGHGANGHGANGHGSNGHGSNGYGSNGHSPGHGTSGRNPVDPRADLIEYLRQRISGILGVSNLDVEAPLEALGFDSLMAVEMKNRVEMDLSLTVSVIEFMRRQSTAELASRLSERLPSESSQEGVEVAAEKEWETFRI